MQNDPQSPKSDEHQQEIPVLQCRSCNKFADRSDLILAPGAQFGGYNSIEWADPQAQVPTGENWRRSDVAPEVGTKRLARIKYPLCLDAAEGVWLLFQPRSSRLDGWLDFPDQVPLSAIARCSFSRLFSRDKHSAWVELEVHESVSIPELVGRVDESAGAFPLKNFDPKPYWVRTPEWTFIDWSCQGDIGEWVVIRHAPEPARVVLHGDWCFDRDWFYVMNQPLSAVDLHDVMKKSKAY